ncbi:hypothetical protein [Shewanella frigidimarina]|uniref:hypothetical protein n=1 Tax=Shewanella frigidimarina TaxID=56812 RepID=UPI003D7B5554|tara:strand:+ start:1062 stop:1277 length:216 start_codon:yes stop_codon:yes gene_type:complete
MFTAKANINSKAFIFINNGLMMASEQSYYCQFISANLLAPLKTIHESEQHAGVITKRIIGAIADIVKINHS